MTKFTERERLAMDEAERAVLRKHGLLPNGKDLWAMSQAELKKEYEQQRTSEGQKALEIKRELSKKFADITGKAPQRIGTVQAMHNEKTGEVRYCIID